MCDPFNELECLATMSTIGTPDATFVAQKVGEDLQFRGLELGPSLTATVSPINITINAPSRPLPVVDGVVGLLDQINFSPLPSPSDEIPFTLLSTTYSTGIFVGSTLTISASTYYKVCFNPGFTTGVSPSDPIVTYRIRNSSNVIYAEFYSKALGNDENTTSFDHVMFLPADTYTFSVQITGITDYLGYGTIVSHISVKRISA